ncbi:MSHA pilin protein MshA [Mariprofundus ferrinatatus]|uniref:Type II secretion system protein H n=2 Tax=Mariprofundus ferrinatatus TaxID=1921087 RepID=A0A2K8L5J4_9PROT|nr:MSHA pilin protein MshA [Mariprofundus ferrinatatus]
MGSRQVEVLESRDSFSGQYGFSLLEMIIVIVIVGVMSSVAIPAFSSWKEKQSVRSASQSLLSHMKQARVQAVAENRSVSLSFTSTGYTYDADLSGSCGQCSAQAVSLGQYSSKLSLSPTTTRTFTSRGTANAGTITITAGTTSQAISLNIIGRAYLQ